MSDKSKKIQIYLLCAFLCDLCVGPALSTSKGGSLNLENALTRCLPVIQHRPGVKDYGKAGHDQKMHFDIRKSASL